MKTNAWIPNRSCLKNCPHSSHQTFLIFFIRITPKHLEKSGFGLDRINCFNGNTYLSIEIAK